MEIKIVSLRSFAFKTLIAGFKKSSQELILIALYM